jgi:hypothetical protein
MCELVGADAAQRLREASFALYEHGLGVAAERGIIIADTKFEFGRDADGTIRVMDEVLTPDSSRFWPAERTRPAAASPRSTSSRCATTWRALRARASGTSSRPAPDLPEWLVQETSARYQEIFRRLTGMSLDEFRPTAEADRERSARRRRRLRRAVVILPSAFTLGNLFLGLWAIVSASRGQFVFAGWLIVLAAMPTCSTAASPASRSTGSEFGEQLDSLVDAISFGVAPALIMYFLFLSDGGQWAGSSPSSTSSPRSCGWPASTSSRPASRSQLPRPALADRGRDGRDLLHLHADRLLPELSGALAGAADRRGMMIFVAALMVSTCSTRSCRASPCGPGAGDLAFAIALARSSRRSPCPSSSSSGSPSSTSPTGWSARWCSASSSGCPSATRCSTTTRTTDDEGPHPRDRVRSSSARAPRERAPDAPTTRRSP